MAAIPQVPLMFLSATLTPFNLKSIREQFWLNDENSLKVIKQDISRPNLKICIRQFFFKSEHMRDLALIMRREIEANPDSRKIIFFDSIAKCSEIRDYLRKKLNDHDGIEQYHADLEPTTEPLKLDSLMSGRHKIIVATECLGMVISTM